MHKYLKEIIPIISIRNILYKIIIGSIKLRFFVLYKDIYLMFIIIINITISIFIFITVIAMITTLNVIIIIIVILKLAINYIYN